MPAPTCVITSIKRFNYRGDANEEFSNTYMFTGSAPADGAAWRALADALAVEERKIFPSVVQIIRFYGYNKVPVKGDHADYQLDLTVAPNTVVTGSLTLTTASRAPGDSASWIRWGLDRLNERGKRIYLRKYFHPAWIASGQFDQLDATYVTALNTFGAKLDDGTFITARRITDKLGTATIGHGVAAYATTRTLKRRPKRAAG